MKKPKVDKPKHPSEVNGDSFQSPGGKNLYDMMYGIHGRVSRLEAGGAIVLLLLGVILAKLFGAIPD